MGNRLEGRVAIVTGGGHSIGKEYCRGLAEEGAIVVVAEIDAPAAGAVAAELTAKGHTAVAIPTDVSDEDSAQDLAARTLERFGRIDILVNNAAMFATVQMSRVPIEDVSVAEWDKMMAVNLRGVFLCSRAVVPTMRAQGRGRIINISSTVWLNGSATRIHYVTSKAGVVGFTRSLSAEVAADGITVNAIAPGGTVTDENREWRVQPRADAPVRTGRPTYIPRQETPDDLMGAVIFLASDDSAFVTGQLLVVDGGRYMH